jgi:hypothetical protein
VLPINLFKSEPPKRIWTRRKLIASFGALGAAIFAGGWFSFSKPADKGAGVDGDAAGPPDLNEWLPYYARDQERANNPLIGRYKTVKNDTEYNSWPVLVRTKANRFIAFYACGPSHKSNGGKDVAGRKVCYKLSDNDGLTWSEEKVLLYKPDTDYTTFGAAALKNGDIILFSNENTVKGTVTVKTDYLVLRSTDNGASFSLSFRLRTDSTDPVVKTSGYPNVPVEMDNGEIIASKQINVNGKKGWGVIFSKDNGLTFQQGVKVISPTHDSYSDIPWEVRIAYIGQGRLVAMGRNDKGPLYQLNSGDYGRTWTQFTTNITDCRFNCVFPLYMADLDTITLYYNDRYSNTIKKRTAPATFIFNNPNQWNEATVIDYTSSPTTKIDSGYITSCRIRDYRNETMSCLYTTRDVFADEDTPKNTGIVIFYDTVEAPKTSITKENVFISGGFSTWQYGSSFKIADRMPIYTASQWLFQGTGTNVVAKSYSPLFNKPTLKIATGKSESWVRLYQPLISLSKNTFTLTTRMNVADDGECSVKLLLKWSKDGAQVSNTDLDKAKVVKGYKTVSFTFQCPMADLTSPVFVGLEMESKHDLFIYEMKLESGHAFTGFNEADAVADLAKASCFYEEFQGTVSFAADREGNLLHTMTFSPKVGVPEVQAFWNDEANVAGAWHNAEVGKTGLTVQAGGNFAVFSGAKPAGTTPVRYDVDKIVVDARVWDREA